MTLGQARDAGETKQGVRMLEKNQNQTRKKEK